jgi:hypothetical protein
MPLVRVLLLSSRYHLWSFILGNAVHRLVRFNQIYSDRFEQIRLFFLFWGLAESPYCWSWDVSIYRAVVCDA